MNNDSCELSLFASNTDGAMLNANGKVTTNPEEAVVSQLYLDLLDYYKDRKTAIKFWSLAHDASFLQEYRDKLTFDAVGEVTKESLLNVIPNEVKGEQRAIDFNTKRMNKALSSTTSSREQLKKAIELVTSFNEGTKGIQLESYSAIIEYKDELHPSKGYQISIVPKNSKNRKKFETFMKHQNLLERIYYRLAQAGLKADFLKIESDNRYTRDFNEAEAAHTGLLTAVGLSEAPSDIDKYNDEVISQTARLLLDSLENNEPDRHKLLLDSLTEDDFLEFYGATYDRNLLEDETAKREVAANLIAKALKRDNSRKFFSRAVRWFLNKMKLLRRRLTGGKEHSSYILEKDRQEAYYIAQKVANTFLEGDAEVKATRLYSKESPIGTPKLTRDHKLVYDKIVGRVRQLVSDMVELNPALASHYESLLQAVEHDVNEVNNKSYDDLLAIQNIIDACRRLHEGLDDFWKSLNELDFEHQGTPVEEVEKYKKIREIKQYIAYVREIQHTLDDLLENRDKVRDIEAKALYKPLFEARKLLDDFITSKNKDSLSLQEIVDRKEMQCVARFLEQIYGTEYITEAVHTVFRDGKLTTISDKYRFFDANKAKARAAAIQEIINYMNKSNSKTTISEEDYKKLSLLAKEMWDNTISKLPSVEVIPYVKSELEKFEEASTQAITDFLPEEISWFDENIRSMSNNPDIMGQLLDRVVKQGNAWSNQQNINDRDALARMYDAWNKIHKRSIANPNGNSSRSLYENDKNGDPDGYLVSEYNTGKWASDFNAFKEECIAKFYELYPNFKPKVTKDGDVEMPSVAAKIAFNSYFRKEKAKWHKQHSHFDENLQQWRPGKKVFQTGVDNINRTSAIFGDPKTENPVNLNSYNNTPSDNMNAIAANSKILGERDAGQYRGTDGSRYVRMHRLLEERDSRLASTYGDSFINGEYTEESIESMQRGSRVDEFLRVLFENKGQDIQAAKDAANSLVVDLPEAFPTQLLDDELMNTIAKEAINLMQAFAARGIKWSTRDLQVNTAIDGLNIAGEMDLLLEYPDGTLEPWDFKTSKSDYPIEKNENYKTQVNFYNKALKDKGYQSRVGGVIRIDAKNSTFEIKPIDEVSLDTWRVTPFETRYTDPKGFSFRQSIATQLELEKQADFPEGEQKTYGNQSHNEAIFGRTSSSSENVIPRPTHTISLQEISRQQALHVAADSKFYEDIKWAIDKEGLTPYEALAKFKALPQNINNIPTDYVIDPDGEYKSEQYENMSLEERKVLKSLLDFKWEKDEQYPKGAVKYATAPQVRGRTINKLRNRSTNTGFFERGSVTQWQDMRNKFCVDADDYEFGDNTTYDGTEPALLTSSVGYNTDRIKRVPVLGVNPIIDPNWKKKLDVYNKILNLYKNIERASQGSDIKVKNSAGIEIKRKRTKEETDALIASYKNEILQLAKANKIKDYDRESIEKAYETIKRRSATELSTEVFHSMMVYSTMSNNYKAMTQIVDVAEMGSDIIAKRQVKGKPKSFRSYHRWKSYLEKEFYNVQTENVEVLGISINKLAGVLGRMASFSFLKGNTKAGMVNAGTGAIELYKEAIVGQFINPSTFRKALAIYFTYSYNGKRVFEGGEIVAGKDFKDDFLSLFIEKFNTQRKAESKFMDYNPERIGLINLNPLGDKMGYLPFEEGDRFMQTIMTIALALETSIYDTKTGKTINLFDAYRKSYELHNSPKDKHKTLNLDERYIKSQEGENDYKAAKELKSLMNDYLERVEDPTPEKIITMLTSSPNSSPEILQYYIKNVKDKYEERVNYIQRNSLRAKANIMDFIDDAIDSIKWNEAVDNLELEIKADELNIRMHGIYNTTDKVKFQQNVYGNAVMGMRGYMLGAVEKGFLGYHYSTALEEGVESEFASFAHMFAYLLVGAVDESGKKLDKNFLNRLNTVYKASVVSTMAFNNKVRTEKRYQNEKYLEENGFSRGQYYANRRRQIHFLTIIILTTAAALLRAIAWNFDDDDDDVKKEESAKKRLMSHFLGCLHYLLFRVGIEQKAYATRDGLAMEIPSAFDVTPIGFSAAYRFANIGEMLVKGERYSHDGVGYEPGDLKGLIQLSRMIPWYKDYLWLIGPWTAEKGYLYQLESKSDTKSINFLDEPAKKLINPEKYKAEKTAKEKRKKGSKKGKGKKLVIR